MEAEIGGGKNGKDHTPCYSHSSVTGQWPRLSEVWLETLPTGRRLGLSNVFVGKMEWSCLLYVKMDPDSSVFRPQSSVRWELGEWRDCRELKTECRTLACFVPLSSRFMAGEEGGEQSCSWRGLSVWMGAVPPSVGCWQWPTAPLLPLLSLPVPPRSHVASTLAICRSHGHCLTTFPRSPSRVCSPFFSCPLKCN